MSTTIGKSTGTDYKGDLRVVAFGAVRLMGGTGGLWKLIEDDDHGPGGFTAVETLDDCIRLHHEHIRVGMATCNTDERFALSGIRAGISAGTVYAEVWFTQINGNPPFERLNARAAVLAAPYTNIWVKIETRAG